MDKIFRDMQAKGLVSVGSDDWILKAIAQRNPRLTVDLAHSIRLPLIQDNLGKVMATVLPIETAPITWD